MAEKEYIEREQAYKACEKYFNGVCGYDVSESEVINDFEKIIDSVPTADVAPVRHGRWVRKRHLSNVIYAGLGFFQMDTFSKMENVPIPTNQAIDIISARTAGLKWTRRFDENA